MNKLDLKNVTLFCLGSDHLDEARFAVETCKSFCDFGAIHWIVDKIDNNNRPHEHYNHFIINELVTLLETDFVLVMQWDGFILNPDGWNPEFLNYDYIGAAWDLSDERSVGNGGFSIRSKRLMTVMSELELPLDQCMPEDQVICMTYRKYLEDRGMTFAPASLANTFSVETNNYHPQIRWDGQFGFHNIYTEGVQKRINEIKAN